MTRPRPYLHEIEGELDHDSGVFAGVQGLLRRESAVPASTRFSRRRVLHRPDERARGSLAPPSATATPTSCSSRQRSGDEPRRASRLLPLASRSGGDVSVRPPRPPCSRSPERCSPSPNSAPSRFGSASSANPNSPKRCARRTPQCFPGGARRLIALDTGRIRSPHFDGVRGDVLEWPRVGRPALSRPSSPALARTVPRRWVRVPSCGAMTGCLGAASPVEGGRRKGR